MMRLKYALILLGLLTVLGIVGHLIRTANRTESGLASPATQTSSANPSPTPDFTRVIPAKDIGKLVNKPRVAWVKSLGKPTEIRPPFRDIAGES
jgi:hypothetical protein